MSTFSQIWANLGASKEYREHFVEAQVKRAIPLQVRALLKEQGLKQQELAELSGVSQGTISRAIDPEYGDLTLNTIIRIAAGLDVAFIGRFVPFSELVSWFDGWTEAAAKVMKFEDEDQVRKKRDAPVDEETAQIIEHAKAQLLRVEAARAAFRLVEPKIPTNWDPRAGQLNLPPAEIPRNTGASQKSLADTLGEAYTDHSLLQGGTVVPHELASQFDGQRAVS